MHVQLDENAGKEQTSVTPGDYVMLAVSDTGFGMDKETQQHIFEPFFTTKKELGTGLGLATVYGIVKQHGGNIWVYSEQDKGTTFKVYLPAVQAEIAAAEKSFQSEKDLRGSETVLVVEDNEMAREVACDILERLGYTVLSAAGGKDALNLLSAYVGPVNLLLTDVVMPDMDGKTLFGKISRIRPGIRALFMSGYTQNVIAHHGVLDEGVRFIQKPFTYQALAAKVSEVLKRK
jgi:two-component system, cell cycle sensor histidine kinase and response regulator CckA